MYVNIPYMDHIWSYGYWKYMAELWIYSQDASGAKANLGVSFASILGVWSRPAPAFVCAVQTHPAGAHH